MPDLLEHMYCAQQINIPPNLPFILKQYAKAAIRTQPYDLLHWSAAYFRAKANNSPPPVKERLEYPPFDSPSRLSPGFLKVLHKQLGSHDFVREEVLYEKWLGVCLVKEALGSMLKIGAIKQRVPWLKFVAIAAGHICTSLGKTMVLLCEIITDQPDGGAAWIPVEKFVELYKYLASLNCGPSPPKIRHVDMDIETPSATTTQVSSFAESKAKSEKDEEEVDSTAGLMVWPDIQPPQQGERLRSPKAGDEAGASSELGVEVYDTAKGTVTELVTLYSAAPTTTKTEGRVVTVVSEDTSQIGAKHPKIVESVEDGILSHTSLKENEDWIKVNAKNLEEQMRESEQHLDLDKLVDHAARKQMEVSMAKSSSKAEKKSGEEESEDGEEEEEGEEGDEDKPGDLVGAEKPEDENSDKVEAEGNSKSTISKKDRISNITMKEKGEEGGDSDSRLTVAGRGATTDSQADEDHEDHKKITFESLESEFALDNTITMTNFDRTRDPGYSVVEIRKGRVGDKSVDQIESTEGPMASETVHRLNAETSEESVSQSAESDEQEPMPYWEHVPGIGPVIPEAQVLAVVEYMQHWATKQEGMVGPRNINHLLCPPLDLPPAELDEVTLY